MERVSLIYDGRCPRCTRWADWASRRAAPGTLETLSCEAAETRVRFPEVSVERCLGAMVVVLSDGTTASGVDALPHIVARLRGWSQLAPLLRLRAVRGLVRPVYWLLARTRRRVPCE